LVFLGEFGEDEEEFEGFGEVSRGEREGEVMEGLGEELGVKLVD